MKTMLNVELVYRVVCYTCTREETATKTFVCNDLGLVADSV